MVKKGIIIVILIIVILLFMSIKLLTNKMLEKDKVNFYFFALEEADSSIISYKENIIMIDTGEKKDQGKIEKEFKRRKIKKIDYLILTHPDKDHIGNAKYLIENYEVGQIFQTDYNKNSDLQEELNKIIEEKDIENLVIKEEKVLQIEDLEIKIYPPINKYEDSNNNSLITLINFKGRKALYTGDIKEERIQDIIESLPEVDLLKYPAHGRKSELSKEFIEKVKPKMAVITGNEPDEEIIKKLEEIDCKIRLTKNRSVEVSFE